MQRPAANTIGLISLGCAKNLVDSETLAGLAMKAGFVMAPHPERAAVVVINTCAFIKDAQQESIDTILEACSWKRAGPCRAVLVCGCLPQRHAAEIAGALPEVDAFIGLDKLPEIGAVLHRLQQGEQDIVSIPRRAQRVIEPPAGRPLLTPQPYAYLKIAEGCDNRCHYCTIPGIRGRYRSRPINSVIREAEELLGRGVRELNLISQDVTAYGRDRNARGELPRLLRALGKIGGRFWIRLLYGHPAHVTPAMLAAMAEVRQVCRYLDLPIQHSHPEVLAAMGRPSPRQGLARLFEEIRERLPGIALRTTCMVGYPGETARHFQHLLDFTAAVGFDHLGVFRFSPEPGTAAADLPRRVGGRCAVGREKRLMLQQRRLVAERGRQLVGQADTILLEQPRPRRPAAWIGRSDACAPEVDGVTYVNIAHPTPRLRPGSFLRVHYTRTRGYDMEART